VPRQVAEVVAAMLDADCPCRQRLVAALREGGRERLASLVLARAGLASVVESAYASTAASLLREFRIFTGANAVAFALLGLVTYFRRRAALQILLPAIVLVGAVALTGGIYLLRQDWLHTIVFGDYVGWAYAAWLASVALGLADIVFNRARVTTRVVNVALDAIGSVASAVPC
jgi:hypothetical protein